MFSSFLSCIFFLNFFLHVLALCLLLRINTDWLKKEASSGLVCCFGPDTERHFDSEAFRHANTVSQNTMVWKQMQLNWRRTNKRKKEHGVALSQRFFALAKFIFSFVSNILNLLTLKKSLNKMDKFPQVTIGCDFKTTVDHHWKQMHFLTCRVLCNTGGPLSEIAPPPKGTKTMFLVLPGVHSVLLHCKSSWDDENAYMHDWTCKVFSAESGPAKKLTNQLTKNSSQSLFILLWNLWGVTHTWEGKLLCWESSRRGLRITWHLNGVEKRMWLAVDSDWDQS